MKKTTKSIFKDVIGYEDVKVELVRIIDIMRNPGKYAALGVSMPTGVMLHGEPGVGKTLMSKRFVEASGLPCFTCRKDKSDDAFIETIRDTYEKAAAKAPAIVFLDDVDKFANEDFYHRDAEAYVTIQSCIDEVKGKGVFTIATANNIDKLPPSLIRAGRFDKVIEMNIPSGDDAVNIVKHYLGNKGNVSADVNPSDVARLLNGGSCA